MNTMKYIGLAAVPLAMSMAPAHAGGFITEFGDVEIAGGAAGGYYAADKDVTRKNDQNRLSDFLLSMDATSKDERVSLSAGIGIQPAYNLLDSGVVDENSTDLQYATLAVHPLPDWTLELGLMPSNIGYEDTASFYNAHSIASVQSTMQPGYSPATRLTYGNDTISVYVEQKDDMDLDSNQAWATGAMGTMGNIEYAIGYQNISSSDISSGRSLFELILSGNLAGMDVSFVFDQHKLTDAPADADHAESVALYFSGPSFDDISIPVRLESFNDHGTDIYGGSGNGQSLTVTPTWNLSENAYIRTDFSFMKVENNILDNNTADSRSMIVLQAGYRI